MPTPPHHKENIHALYEQAVQQPEHMVGFIEHVYMEQNGSAPATLREDFSGTSILAATWVKSDSQRHAVAIDYDPLVLAYAESQHRQSLGNNANRLSLLQADVTECSEHADVTTSLNFSHFIYKTRSALLRYFKHTKQCLKPKGLFISDLYGGPGALVPCLDERKLEEFIYQWEQVSYNPHTAEVINRIHFLMNNDHKILNAFEYDWRLWSLAEIHELLDEAGFAHREIWFETDEGFVHELDTQDLEAWVAYVIAHG